MLLQPIKGPRPNTFSSSFFFLQKLFPKVNGPFWYSDPDLDFLTSPPCIEQCGLVLHPQRDPGSTHSMCLGGHYHLPCVPLGLPILSVLELMVVVAKSHISHPEPRLFASPPFLPVLVEITKVVVVESRTSQQDLVTRPSIFFLDMGVIKVFR